MKLQKWVLAPVTVAATLALAAGDVLAQDGSAGSEAQGPTGLPLFFLLIGLLSLVFVGVMRASKESAENGSS